MKDKAVARLAEQLTPEEKAGLCVDESFAKARRWCQRQTFFGKQPENSPPHAIQRAR